MTDEFDDLLDALTGAYHRLTALSDALHGFYGLSAGTRSVLLLLARGEALTLSEIADRRAVSRQFIQKLVAPLVAQGLLTADANPRHKRSPKLRLSPWGEQIVAKLRAREAATRARIAGALPPQQLAPTKAWLEALSAALAEAMPDNPPPRSKARPAAR